MAQRTENEETEFKIVPEAITPLMVSPSPPSSSSSSSSVAQNSIIQHKSGRSASPRSSPAVKLPELVREKRDLEVKETVIMKREVNRCSGCRRKVGLTGFRCRCGELFCSQHRYSDRHDCSYDYKSAGREVIARENPVVKAAKIVKI